MSFPRSYPQYLTRAEATFDSFGGRLTAPDSNVTINVESGAVPNGVSQQFYFGVVYDDTLLLRDIPETSQRSLISPVIKCGPDDIDLLKPVEIILPHCLYMDEVKKSWVSVFRCRQFSEKGAFSFRIDPLMAVIFLYKTMKRRPILCIKTNPVGIELLSMLDTKIPELTILVFFL